MSFKQTKTNTLEISVNQFLKDIIPEIPSNHIAFKKLPGLGATTLELETKKRNSIVIEPNVPVIQGKCKLYNTTRKTVVLGVYEGVTEEQITEYLQSGVTPKKFIVTPESFKRVKQAILESENFDLYKDFFLLFDECERTIQDVNYRADIILPMLDFFTFKDKAFISATPIIPSDPRFVLEGFEALYIQPNYEYKEHLTLISTNNILFTFEKFIKDNPREKYFIFFNSTDSIAQLILTLDIKKDSAIFCAKESKQKLKVNDFSNVHTNIDTFKKFNFFTSRFFSAVDIEYERYLCDPTIIMITDLSTAQHSMIDPLSEAIQIVGRFRKPKDATEKAIKKEVIHITNYDPVLSSRNREETIQYVHERFIVYEHMKRFLDASTTKGAVDAINEMLERSEYKRFINPDGTRNYFMQDNLIEKEQVNGFYQSSENLINAYDLSGYFNLTEIKQKFDFTDKNSKDTNRGASLKSVYEVVSPVLNTIHQPGYNMYLAMGQMQYLENEYPQVVSAFRILGYDKLKELNFNPIRIKNLIRQKDERESMFGLLVYIEKHFKSGEEIPSNEIVDRLRRGIRALNLHHLTANVPLLRKYCRLSHRITIKRDRNGREIKGYRILEIYNTINI